ncbi:uncharacterized protein LOC125748894 [Brienomyrus brachyistius]|uniref:uncharacterized protein LOC125748894 n=1 Tax=Brienomyrus brachyistius TaxID=42636 RepID=UPI0020B36F58|nr:uncharacterized protein LOC125748894 [Brienomyrus brachyistius]
MWMMKERGETRPEKRDLENKNKAINEGQETELKHRTSTKVRAGGDPGEAKEIGRGTGEWDEEEVEGGTREGEEEAGGDTGVAIAGKADVHNEWWDQQAAEELQWGNLQVTEEASEAGLRLGEEASEGDPQTTAEQEPQDPQAPPESQPRLNLKTATLPNDHRSPTTVGPLGWTCHENENDTAGVRHETINRGGCRATSNQMAAHLVCFIIILQDLLGVGQQTGPHDAGRRAGNGDFMLGCGGAATEDWRARVCSHCGRKGSSYIRFGNK